MTATETKITPDDLRVDVRGSRWYHDPLPTCELAEATTERWPAVSTVKKAWDKPYRRKLSNGELVKLDAYWVAEFAMANIERLFDQSKWPLERERTLVELATAGGRTLAAKAERGTNVHKVLEDLAEPDVVIDDRFVPDDARPYLPACRAFVADCRPRWLLSEFVVYNRSLGYAGTADALLDIGGVTYLVDWKSRGERHGAFEEEAAQIGGYSMAEYAIIDGRRVRLPKIDAGLIVSLTPDDGYRLFPIDLDHAVAAFGHLLECWQTKRDGTALGRRAIGKPVELTVVDERTEARASYLRERVRLIKDESQPALDALAAAWPAGVPTFKQGGHTPGQLEILAAVIRSIEDRFGLPF